MDSVRSDIPGLRKGGCNLSRAKLQTWPDYEDSNFGVSESSLEKNNHLIGDFPEKHH